MGGLIGKLLRKLRGVLGLGLVGGAVGFFGGGVVHLVLQLLSVWVPGISVPWGTALITAMRWGSFGAFAGAGFGGLLALTTARRTLQELSGWKVGVLGAAVGALFFPAFIIGGAGFERLLLFTLSDALLNAGTFGLLGAGLSWSMVTLAKRADRAELTIVEEVKGLIGTEAQGEVAAPSKG
jgi:hypothetical protein